MLLLLSAHARARASRHVTAITLRQLWMFVQFREVLHLPLHVQHSPRHCPRLVGVGKHAKIDLREKLFKYTGYVDVILGGHLYVAVTPVYADGRVGGGTDQGGR